MEANGLNLRMSGRKAKRRTFNDFISTADWVPTTLGKRKSNDTSLEIATKLSKQENVLESKSDLCSDQDNASQSDNSVVPKPNEETQKSSTQKKDGNALRVTKHSVKSSSAKTVFKKTFMKANFAGASLIAQKHNKEVNSEEVKVMHVCKKSGCRKSGLICCIKATNNCMESSGKSSRWYHMSMEEHYCNGCFEQFYRVKNSGCDEFHDWKRTWMQNSKADGNFRNLTTYIAERQLPYWVQCTLCGHWRSLTNEIELTPDIARTYTCIKGNLANTADMEQDENGHGCRRAPHIKYSCSAPNESSVDVALDPNTPWMALLNYIPFLKQSPAAPFLTGYYPDGVGMSAVDTTNTQTMSKFACDTEDDDVIRPADVMERINCKQKNGVMHSRKKGSHLNEQTSMMTSPGGRKHAYKEPPVPVEGLNPYFQPFYKPHERGKALCMRPDVMELDEAEEFPMYYKDQTVYLGLRNLIIALWILNPRRFLTVEKCCQHVLMRGLSRVRLCTIDVPRILHFVTRKGLVNSGALGRKVDATENGSQKLKPGMLPEAYSKQKVVVIGAGPAGLAASRQLHNFGCKVICLEARDRIGGRVHDDWSLGGVCVGRGAQIINGCVNNPLALIAHQLGLKMHTLQPRCDLFDGTSEQSTKRRPPTKPVSLHCDKRMDFHFNSLLDIIVEWRQAQVEDAEDCSLGEKIQEAHQEWIKQSGLSFTKLEERLLNFHIGNLEFACGASLDKVSAFHWDQNEIFAQFSGDHTFAQFGFSSPLAALATDLDVRFNSPVAEITYNDSQVEVKTKGGTTFQADRVLVAVPLAVLRSGSIRFHPDLPLEKKEAMNRLGCGCIEKIALQFSNRFWDAKINGANYFGYVPLTPDNKGFFSVFYDVPYPQCEKSNVLMSVISGEAVEVARGLTDQEIVDIALSILRDIFPEKAVPQPSNYFLTRWRDDEYSQMAYSYVKRGSSGDDYDHMAKEVDDKLFFAGESKIRHVSMILEDFVREKVEFDENQFASLAKSIYKLGTNRHFPQTVTGAYLSGLREASKIVSHNKLKQSSSDIHSS